MRYCEACHSSYPDDFTVCPRDQSALRSGTELQPGMVLRGKYEILERVGRGGMASVYRARHRAFGEIRAIKVVGASLADHDDFLRRFHQEAVVARKLHHPHAVRVEDLDTTDDGRPFIVMEYVEGRNLREVIRQEGALSVPRALRIAQEVASALAAAHGLGIVHRDIKPDNVLLTTAPDGSEIAKVLDFGIAKVKEGAFDTGPGYAPTQTGVVVGTPQYISPEQAMGKRGDEVDGRSDLYSLGVVLYEMVTGRLPFQSDTAMGLILHHLQTAPTPPHLVRPELGLPPALSDVLMTALQKDPHGRYGSATEMLRALQAVPAAAPRTPPPLPLPAGALPLPGRAPDIPTPKPPATMAGDIEELPTRAFPKTPEPVTPVVQPTSFLPPPPLTGATRPKSRRWRVVLGIGLAVFLVSRFTSRSRSARESDPQPSPSILVGGHPDPEAKERLEEVERPEAKERAEAPEAKERAEAPEAKERAEEVERATEARSRARDERIQAEVEHLLSLTPLTRDQSLEVEVDEGIVTLSGKVSRAAAVEVAHALASSVAEVKQVRMEIEVEGAPLPPRRADVPFAIPVPPAPPAAPFPLREGSPEAQALKELLASGKRDLENGNAFGAVAAYKAAVSLDPTNREARDGLIRATQALAKERSPRRRPSHSRPPNRG